MQRFILKVNIAKFERAMDECTASEQPYLRKMLDEMRRELAMLESNALGAQKYRSQFGPIRAADRAEVERLLNECDKPAMLIDPREGLHILDVNDAHAAMTFKRRREVAGERLFEVFPENPQLVGANSVVSLFDSIKMASHSLKPHVREIRYDLQDEAGRFLPRLWRTISIPLVDGDGRLTCILHQAEAEEVAVVGGDDVDGDARHDAVPPSRPLPRSMPA